MSILSPQVKNQSAFFGMTKVRLIFKFLRIASSVPKDDIIRQPLYLDFILRRLLFSNHSLSFQILRHGDRAPVFEYPNDPLGNESLWFPYADGFGGLTKVCIIFDSLYMYLNCYGQHEFLAYIHTKQFVCVYTGPGRCTFEGNSFG